MLDETPLDRRCRLLRILMSSHFGLTLREISQEFGVSQKTVLRDLQGLSSVGFVIREDLVEHGCKRWRLVDGKKLPPLRLAFEEASALLLAVRSLDPLAGTHYWKAARKAIAKVRVELGTEVLRYLDKVSDHFHHAGNHFAHYSDKAPVIETIATACEEGRKLNLEYQSMKATAPSWREVHPRALVRFKESLYLVAFAPDHGEIREYKVDRVSKAILKDETFPSRENLDMKAHFAKKWGMHGGDREVVVRVRFRPEVARYVLETVRHPGQILTSEPDGGLTAQFTLSTTIEIKSWILSFGATALVLEPHDLRDEIQADLRRMLAAYQADPRTPPANVSTP